MLRDDVSGVNANAIEVAMPIGLYTSCEVSAPCGLCSPQGIIGLLDVPGTFLDPDRMNAGLMWFTRGFAEYQFPNNARHVGKAVDALEFSLELSSEVPGTASDWPSDITVAVNGWELGVLDQPRRFRRSPGSLHSRLVEAQRQPIRHAEELEGDEGRRVRRRRQDLVADTEGSRLSAHHSIRLKIEVKADARHPGGVNIFGRGFGNYDQDIVLKLTTEP